MSISVFLSMRTGMYHLATDEQTAACRSPLAVSDKWTYGTVASIVADVLCPICAQAYRTYPGIWQGIERQVVQSVYIIRQMGTHYYKIGVAADVDHRLRQLQCGNSYSLQVIWYSDLCDTKIAHKAERSVHQAYRHMRVGGRQREWFNLGPHEIKGVQKLILDVVG